MKLTNYCLVARLTKNPLPKGIKFFTFDPDAEIFDLTEGKSVVIVNNKKLGNFDNIVESKPKTLLPTSKEPIYGMAIVGETEDDIESEYGKYIAFASTREELYDVYAEMYANGVIGSKESRRYLPKINKFIEDKYGLKNM